MLRPRPGQTALPSIPFVQRAQAEPALPASAPPVPLPLASLPPTPSPAPPLALHPLDLLEAVRVQLDGDATPPDGPGVAAAVVDEFKRVLFEHVYPTTHPDIGRAVATGGFPTGWDHWVKHGRMETGELGRDMRLAPSRRQVREQLAAGLLPETRLLIDYVADWGALMRAFARGERYVPAEERPRTGRMTATVAVRQVSTPGLESHYAVDPQLVAFYLPQYHRVRENDEWWGEGFTEWTNVRKARPNFTGHSQPHVPLGGNYYDLTEPGVQKRQAGLAREYGIRAFCYYMYWFNGRRVLERPLDQLVADPSIDHEFCICWANENWTRAWDGKQDDILIGQTHTAASDRRFIHDAMAYLRDPRYLRIGGKLVLLVYRVDLLEDSVATAEAWREEVRLAGLGELHLCAVQFYGITDPAPWGFDAAVEFPPHGWLGAENLVEPPPTLLNPDFKGHIFDYDKVVDMALSKPLPGYRWYRAAFPGWDNTARRQDTPHIFANATPAGFERWLSALLQQAAIMAPPEHQVVFINAWNEWGEGAYLEPDEASGYATLGALNRAREGTADQAFLLALLGRLRAGGDYPGRDGDERHLLDHVRGHEQAFRALADRMRAVGAKHYL